MGHVKAFYYPDGTKKSKITIYEGEQEGFADDEKGPIELGLGDSFTISALDSDEKVYVEKIVEKMRDSHSQGFDSVEYHLVPQSLRKNRKQIDI